ncbi:hypothetical protein [Flavobacterium pallidum]|uniref:Uncharacterized protein n=1 Tax=Flavobacterium pallidum TaxID=2172098 RepID=A0A2S1SKH8_9FLAO|nr:hypothetical protein [Flavobacterium pallidum]AWI26847.1 hypothetical protein HYN49_13580 [Flavobacterium pallidum]
MKIPNVNIFLTFLFIGFHYCFSQSCGIKNLNHSEKIELTNFYESFKASIISSDKSSLSKLIQFPFNCDYCENSRKPYVKVSRKKFDVDYFNIFYDQKLIEALNEGENFENVIVFNEDNSGICHIELRYVSRESSAQSEGQQHFFSIEKIKNKYYITSAWTVP